MSLVVRASNPKSARALAIRTASGTRASRTDGSFSPRLARTVIASVSDYTCDALNVAAIGATTGVRGLNTLSPRP